MTIADPLPSAKEISAADPCSLVLAPHQGDRKVDREITLLQQLVRVAHDPDPWLERLGWMFVAKARESFDPGYYKLAEQCAICISSRQPQSNEALLLRGHVLHNLHRFKAAEPLARKLAANRGLAVDFGLLGDVLMEQGRLKEAADAYQRMLDLKPSLHSYSRAAHLRWLKGDLPGAIEVMQLAVAAATPQDAESAAWVNTRLASYEFQAANYDAAARSDDIALQVQHDYAPALLLRGRMNLDNGESEEAIVQLQRAAQLIPLPEYQWTLEEALRERGRDDEAVRVEQLLNQTGAANDPRTYALYLSTRGQSPETAVQLAESEFNERSDIFTHDAVAWSLAAASRIDEALPHLESALSEGTHDARLFFHAAAIYAKAGRTTEASHFASEATQLIQLLLPSERAQLRLIASTVSDGGKRIHAQRRLIAAKKPNK